MSVIRIEALVPSSGAVPSNGYDAVSQAAYTEWRVGDEARFSLEVPDGYLSGQDFFVRLHESTPSISGRHKWQVKTLLLRPGLNVTDQQSLVEIFGRQLTSVSTPDQLTVRTFAVTGASAHGKVGNGTIQPGDVLVVTLKRVSVASGEDPNPVKVFSISVSVALDIARVSECSGRVGNIVDTVRDLFNDSTGGFLEDELILRAINRCQEDLAKENYWRRETWIPAASGVSETDLLAAIPRFQDLHQVHFSGCKTPMTPLGSFRDYQELKIGSSGLGTPRYYVVQNSVLHVWPAPAADADNGFCVYHSFLPDDLTCSPVNPNPALPLAHDMLFVYFALKQAFLRDRHAPGADGKFAEYSQLYEMERQRLLGEADPPGLELRPSR